jgi:hypothetical protein
MSIPAIHYNAHYLFEDGVLEFDRPVEIHVSRFSNNQKIVDMDWVSSYPKYDISFDSQDSHKVLITSNEPISSPNRENTEVVIANHEQYDLILTSDDEILRNCSNAVLFPYGTTWLNKGRIDDENAIGHYAPIVDELHNNKKFETSFLCSFHARELDGYQLRKEIWLLGHPNSELIKNPINFYSSPRMIIPNAPDWYLERVMPFTDNPLPNDNKDILFHSQFHVAIESTKQDNYFTEKIIDALITKTVPIYWGCDNIGDFFNIDGIIVVHSVEDAIEKINALTPETYKTMLPHIEENFELAKKYASSFAERVKMEIDKKVSKKLLTVGILSLHERKDSLNSLINCFRNIIRKEDIGKVEFIVNVDGGEKSVGQKRNEVLNQAKGEFVCFVDDDDEVDNEYLRLIIETIENNPELDCIGFTGMYYVNGVAIMLFKHANEYGDHYKKEGIQYRPVNHLNPVRTELARQIGFPDKNHGEDSDYCDRLLESGLLKNEVILDKVMYHYLFSEEESRTHKRIFHA